MTAKERASDNALTVVLGAIAVLPCVMALILISPGGAVSEAWISALFSTSPPLIELYAERFQPYPGNWETRLAALYLVFLLSPLPLLAGSVFSIKVLDKYRRPYISYERRSVIGRVLVGLVITAIVFYASIALAGVDIVRSGSLMRTSNVAMLLVTTFGFWAVGGFVGLIACDFKSLFQGSLGPNSSLKRTNQSLRD